MTYFVTQYNDKFFVIRRVKGYAENMVFAGQKISDSDYKKLWYSTSERTVLKSISGKFDEVRINGVASEILGKAVKRVYPSGYGL